MPELDTRSLLDSGDLGDEHTLLCPECEDPFDYVHPVCVDVDRGGPAVLRPGAAGAQSLSAPRAAREATEHGVDLVAGARVPPAVRPDAPGAATWAAR